MENNYTKAYTEILEILKYLPEESRNKIPNEMLEMFKIKHDKNYKFIIDIDKSFREQNLLDETKAILANIFRDYWATPYQREQILAKENYDRQKLEEEKLQKYNPNNLFKKTKNISPIEVEREKFHTKLINFIKKIFHL